ncbi:MAG: hypothetical protein F6K17_13505, partial [Okeania sp. SIO3C4]|nr:hypothetical protein [Okeania sp. SIO3C4]
MAIRDIEKYMALWSVIIYGRTKEADFRFLAIPEDFTPEDRYWASKYIHGSTVYPEKLKENPRWSLFKNHKHCVIGVTCMVKDLIGSDRRYDYMTEDASRRSIYIFVGYVVKIDRYFNSLEIPPYLENLEFFKSLNSNFFQSLLQSLKGLWHLKDYQFFNKEINKFEYNVRLNHYDIPELKDKVYYNRYDLNFTPNPNEDRAFIWPDSPYNRNKLWENSCKYFYLPHQEISLSLCLGLGQTKDVLEGPFLNATTFGINELQKTSKLIAK